jgi:MinD-like ATPase involved in chromosome partitioning or flagellar assembly
VTASPIPTPTLDVTIASPLGSHQTSLPADRPLGSFLGDLLVSLGLNTGGATGKWALTRGDGEVLSVDSSLAVARVSPGETLRLVPLSADEQPSALDMMVDTTSPRPALSSTAGSPLTTHPAPAGTDGRSLLDRTGEVVPAPVPFFRRLAASLKAGTRSPSQEVLEGAGNSRSAGQESSASPSPADLAVGRPPSAMERVRAEWRASDYLERLDAAILLPRLRRCVTIAIVSPKGGVGKTTVTALVGMLLSQIRRDRIVAIDTNPDYGSLGRVLTPDQQLFVDDLLARMALPDLTLTELDSQLGRAAHGLMVLPAPTDPERMAGLKEPGYRTVITRLKEYVGVIMLDCGTGLQDPAAQAALETCDQIVLITDAVPATASLVAEAGTLLAASGRPITVVVNKMPKKSRLDLDRLGTFVPAANAMLTIPANADGADLLASGAFDWRDAPKPWVTSVRELAVALVADWPRIGLTLDAEGDVTNGEVAP